MVQIKPGIYEVGDFPIDEEFYPLWVTFDGEWIELPPLSELRTNGELAAIMKTNAIRPDYQDEYLSEYGPLRELTDEEVTLYFTPNEIVIGLVAR